MSSSGKPRTAREIIERIRTHSFLLDLDSESEMVKEGALNLQKQLNNALQLLSHDLYSKKSHFVLELVQNADDNQYGPAVTPHLTFQMAPNRLVVVNNEVGFTEDNIQAICSVGASSKSKEVTGYIGEKGIGFKSVFTVSDAPEIHSNGFHFRFDRTDERNLLGYVVPNWREPTEEAQPNLTTIILPAGKEYQFGPETLVDLDARLLLFLNKLRQLTLAQGGGRVSYRRRDEDAVSHLTSEEVSDGGETTTDEARYIRAEMYFLMKEPFTDEKRPGIERSKVVLAFPLDEAGAAMPDLASHVFAFLPVRKMGFKFAIQADFILSASREQIAIDKRWNQGLRNGIATVFLHAVGLFKKTDALAFSYLKYLPAENDISDSFFQPVRQNIIDLLSKAECLPSASGKWKQPSALRLAGNDFRTLFPSEVAIERFGFDYIDQRMQGGDDVLRSLGVKEVLPQDILKLFTEFGAWLKRQSLEWRAKFYAYVANNQVQLLGAGLRGRPCLPISDATLVTPAEHNVFFPLSRDSSYGFEDELFFVDNALYEEAQKYSDQVHKLFAELKVRPAEPYDLVNSHILLKHKGESWKKSKFKALVGHLRYVKDKLKEYLESAAANGKNEAQAFQLIRDGIWVGTKLLTDGSWRFSRIGSLYLSKDYKPRFCMETLLADKLGQDRLVSSDYLAVKPKDTEAEAESWRQFFVRLGILQAPAVVSEGGDWKCSDELQLLLESPQSSVRRSTLECMDRHWFIYSACLTYAHPFSRAPGVERATKFALSLRSTQAPTKKKLTVALSEAYYPTTELKGLLGEGLPYVEADLSETMRDACRITYKLDAKALVKRLTQLKQDGGDTAKQLQGIYRALDERLWDSDGLFIKQAFDGVGLIRTKGAHKAWSKPSEVSWRSNSAFMDSLYPPLQAQYRDFSRFFLDRLGIPRDLPTARWVEALTRLDSVASLDERRTEALAIYRKANGDLRPKFGRDDAPPPGWLKTCASQAVYLNQRGEMVVNDVNLFANDVPELAALFADEEELSFLAIPSVEVPRMSRLLDATDVQRISESARIEVVDAGSGVVDADLTERVCRSVPFFARVLYARKPDTFEHAREGGLFARLREFEVAEVSQVNLSVSLGAYSRKTTADIALSAGRALYKTGARSIKDRLSAELCKFLAAPVDIADTFARILMEDDPDDVEDFLKVRNIGALPSDLVEALDGLGGQQLQDSAADEQDASAPDLSGQEELQNDGASVVSKDGVGAGTKLEPAVSSNPTPDSTALSGSARGTTVGTPPSRTGGGNKADVDSLDARAPTSAPTAPSPASPRAPSPASGESGAPAAPPQTPSGGAPAGASRTASMSGPPSGRSRRRKPKLGQSHPQRTKAGRLMSYAAGPADSDRPNPDDDPNKRAARDATGRAAVAYFLSTQAARWKSLTEMPINNRGFDVHAIAHDNDEEFIEVKGQVGAWTEEGVALTPAELETAQQKGNRYWLCVVEYAQDERRRQLYLVRNPHGLTQQFRFDSGWKSAAERVETVSARPEKDMYINMPGVGRGRILSVRDKGLFFNLHVILEDGRQVNRPFNPAKMDLSKEPMWQG